MVCLNTTFSGRPSLDPSRVFFNLGNVDRSEVPNSCLHIPTALINLLGPLPRGYVVFEGTAR